MPQGSTTVNFGAGALEAVTVVAGQTAITSANLVEAWALYADTVGSFGDDSCWVEQLSVYAGQISAGSGFTIVAKPAIGKAFGVYTIGWVWA